MLRECALECAPFAALLEVWRDRDRAAAEFRRGGGKVVGCLGADVPEEYILAAGMLPVRIPPDPESGLEAADRWLEACFDPMVRSQFDRILRGETASLCDGIAVSNSTDVLVRVYLYLRELRRSVPEAPVPPVAFIDWLFTPSPLFGRHNEAEAARFRKTAEEWAGRRIAPEDLAGAVETLNRERAALRRISALRRLPGPRVSGSEALVITGAGFYMDRGLHASLVEALAREAEAWPELAGHRVFLSGTEQYDAGVYGLLEAAGAVVTGEDHDCGMRWFEGDTRLGESPERGVAERYLLRSPSPKKAGVARRREALCAAAREAGAAGVAVCMDRFEEAASWDFPEEKRALEALGIRAAEFSRLPYPADRDPELRGRIEAFVESLKGGGEDG